MSIGKRIINLARGELNSLLERAARHTEDEDEDEARQAHARAAAVDVDAGAPRPRSRPVRLEDLSDAELTAEIERRQREREAEKRAGGATSTPPGSAGSARARRPSTEGSRAQSTGATRPRGAVDPIARAYAVLELAPGADFEAVRRSYRALMRKYHPDRHASSPDKQKAATELAQKLSEAYKVLEKHLRK